ncbi:MAG: ATP synthase F0 subunit C [Planctomycetota bacterium]|nr:MAG: ATP synthase F0 subunit C [Planctomycetota bacterium]
MKSRAWILVLLGLLLFITPVSAAEGAEDEAATASDAVRSSGLSSSGIAMISATIGAALVVMAGGYSISRIGGSAVESMARQPEASGSINGIALITAAMIEGATLFAVLVCFLAVFWGRNL